MENNNENQITPTEVAIQTDAMMNKLKPFIDNCKTFEEGMAMLAGLAIMIGTCPLMESPEIREHIIRIIRSASEIQEGE